MAKVKIEMTMDVADLYRMLDDDGGGTNAMVRITPVKERVVMHTDMSVRPRITEGDRIYRPLVPGRSDDLVSFEPKLDVTERGDVLVRARYCGEIGLNRWIALGSCEMGIACFCRSDVPDDWDFFTVTVVLKNGSVAIVEPGFFFDETEEIEALCAFGRVSESISELVGG